MKNYKINGAVVTSVEGLRQWAIDLTAGQEVLILIS